MKQVFIRGAYLGIGIVSGVVSKSIFDRLSYKEEDILLWSDSRDIVERYGFPSRTETLRYKNYVVGYDSCRKTPAWVLQTLTRKNLGGDAKRDTCAFKKDTRIDKRFSASDEDFIKSGFSKGHMAPAGDYKSSQTAMEETFYYTNVVPQNFANNSGLWLKLERFCRKLTKNYSKVYIVSGPLFLAQYSPDGGRKFIKYQVIGPKEVAVPTHLYKVIMVEREGKPVAIEAFVVPNVPVSDCKNLREFSFPLETLETKLGFTIFPKLAKEALSQLCDIEKCQLLSKEMGDMNKMIK